MGFMDGEGIKLAIAVANFALTWGLAFYMYITNQNKVTNDRVGRMESEMLDKYEDHAERLMGLETAQQAQPTHKDIAALYESINRLAATVNQLGGETKHQSDCLRMMMANMVNRRAEHG